MNETELEGVFGGDATPLDLGEAGQTEGDEGRSRGSINTPDDEVEGPIRDPFPELGHLDAGALPDLIRHSLNKGWTWKRTKPDRPIVPPTDEAWDIKAAARSITEMFDPFNEKLSTLVEGIDACDMNEHLDPADLDTSVRSLIDRWHSDIDLEDRLAEYRCDVATDGLHQLADRLQHLPGHLRSITRTLAARIDAFRTKEDNAVRLLNNLLRRFERVNQLLASARQERAKLRVENERLREEQQELRTDNARLRADDSAREERDRLKMENEALRAEQTTFFQRIGSLSNELWWSQSRESNANQALRMYERNFASTSTAPQHPHANLDNNPIPTPPISALASTAPPRPLDSTAPLTLNPPPPHSSSSISDAAVPIRRPPPLSVPLRSPTPSASTRPIPASSRPRTPEDQAGPSETTQPMTPHRRSRKPNERPAGSLSPAKDWKWYAGDIQPDLTSIVLFGNQADEAGKAASGEKGSQANSAGTVSWTALDSESLMGIEGIEETASEAWMNEAAPAAVGAPEILGETGEHEVPQGGAATVSESPLSSAPPLSSVVEVEYEGESELDSPEPAES
jgi:FtsZ-binding cell division protein ZapB